MRIGGVGVRSTSVGSMQPERDVQSRFEVVRNLGSGAMGVVDEVVDRETGEHLARKTLQSLEGQALYRLKNEFRYLRDLHHPNLVRLGELIGRGDRWFITMELVDGEDFLEHVRPRDAEIPRRTSDDAKTRELPRTSDHPEGPKTTADAELGDVLPLPTRPGRVDPGRLRAALAQLADALVALHDHGRVHRDLKPSNVLVDRRGRVVVLDFGLVASATEASSVRRTEDYVVGTVPYMAPEQAAGRPVGPKADWYAVGVMVYEALTGRMPFEGGPLQILLAKQSKSPPDPRWLSPEVPDDLADLCLGLLARDPDERADHEAIHALVGDAGPISRTSGIREIRPPFVDREEELAALREALSDVCSGRARSVLVRAESGIGKTALVDAFVGELASTRADAIVLRSHCRTDETVPFNAIDGLVDGLSHALKLLEPRIARPLLPPDLELLVELFPVLERVPVVARLPHGGSRLPSDERRARAFAAFRALLRALAAQAPLVLIVDDLHAADRDSGKELAAFLRAADAPPVLFVATARVGPHAPPSEGWLSTLPVDTRTIALDRLSDACARSLFRHVSGRADADEWDPLVHAAAGHPLHVVELARYARDWRGDVPGSLAAVVADRLAQLDDTQRRVLSAVSLSPRPLAASLLTTALELPRAEAKRTLDRLVAARLVTVERADGDLRVEPRYGTLAANVRETLPEAERRELARALHRALRTTDPEPRDPSAQLAFARLAGDPDSIAELLVVSAERAYRHLAFDRAAALLLEALETRAFEADRARSMRGLAAQCFENAGDLLAAAALFEEIASDVDEPIERARWLASAARCSASAFDLASMHRTASASLEALGETLPDSRIGLVLSSLRLLFGALFVAPIRLLAPERALVSASRHRIRHRVFYALTTGAYLAGETLAMLHASLGVVHAGMAIGPSYERIVSIGVLASISAMTGARRLLDHALRVGLRDAERTEDARGLGAFCFVASVALSKAGRIDEMLDVADRARVVRGAMPAFEYLAICARIGYVHAARGRPRESVHWYEQAFERVPVDREDHLLGLCRDVEETQRALEGRPNEAHARATAAIAKDRFATARGRVAIGDLLLLAREEGWPDSSIDELIALHEQHAVRALFVPDEERIGTCVVAYIRLDRALDRPDRDTHEELVRARRELVQVAREPIHRPHLAVVDAGLAHLAGRRDRALALLDRADREAAGIGHAWAAIDARLLRARILATRGSGEAIDGVLAEAEAIAVRHGHRSAERRIARLARLLGRKGEATDPPLVC